MNLPWLAFSKALSLTIRLRDGSPNVVLGFGLAQKLNPALHLQSLESLEIPNIQRHQDQTVDMGDRGDLAINEWRRPAGSS